MTLVPWDEVREVVDAVLELRVEERAGYLDQACPDPAVRRYVESLIVSYDQAGNFLDEPALASLAKPLGEDEAESRVGRRIGPYQVIEEIGEGGMGTVYRAVRADDQYQQQVAIKLVRSGFDSRFTVGRFKAERQILASLEHPNIARMLDGGTSEDGLPYFVMELIEGQAIDEYCDAHKLPTSERLKLFRTVCSAVHCAHQHLVVHRDLKPGNILVTGEGVPKLLDFGIAKILNPEAFPQAVDPTVTVLRLLTPEYASPEQVRGEAITTASDVYSLGVVLYRLLTGHRPYGMKSRSPHDLARAICETEPLKPSTAVNRIEEVSGAQGNSVTLTPGQVSSTRDGQPERLRRRLAGDVDNIILKALAKEAGRRYGSAEQFSEDIRRHLEGLPVTARKDTVGYRSGKFIQRHKAGVGAAALVLVTLLGGLGATIREAGIARGQRARAERRFNDVRHLANSLMFEIHDAIKDLPGSTPARKLLVDKALLYLDSLSQEANGDPSLQRELAAAYERVGDVQGDSDFANVGDLAGALQSFHKALAIRQALALANPGSTSAQIELSSDYNRIGRYLGDVGDETGALDNLRKALVINERISAGSSNPQALDFLAGGYYFLAARLEVDGDLAGALANYRKAASIRQTIRADRPADSARIRGHMAADFEGLARVLVRQGKISQGAQMHAKGLAIMKELSEADPTNATLRLFLAESYQYFAGALGENGPDWALESYRQAEAIFQALSSVDPANVLARRYWGFANLGIGGILVRKGDPRQGLQRFRHALAIFKTLPTDGPRNVYVLNGFASAYSGFGDAYSALAAGTTLSAKRQIELWRTAHSWYQKSLDIRLDKRNPPAARNVFDSQEPKRLAKNIAKCDAAVAKLGSLPSRASRRPELR